MFHGKTHVISTGPWLQELQLPPSARYRPGGQRWQASQWICPVPGAYLTWADRGDINTLWMHNAFIIDSSLTNFHGRWEMVLVSGVIICFLSGFLSVANNRWVQKPGMFFPGGQPSNVWIDYDYDRLCSPLIEGHQSYFNWWGRN